MKRISYTVSVPEGTRPVVLTPEHGIPTIVQPGGSADVEVKHGNATITRAVNVGDEAKL